MALGEKGRNDTGASDARTLPASEAVSKRVWAIQYE